MSEEIKHRFSCLHFVGCTCAQDPEATQNVDEPAKGEEPGEDSLDQEL